jgi:hypothetical protein
MLPYVMFNESYYIRILRDLHRVLLHTYPTLSSSRVFYTYLAWSLLSVIMDLTYVIFIESYYIRILRDLHRELLHTYPT